MRKNVPVKLLGKALLAGALLAFGAGPAYAATITVTNGANTGGGSLRAAVSNANNGDTINFASGVSTVTLASPVQPVGTGKTITLTSGHPVTITGGDTGVRTAGADWSIFKTGGENILKLDDAANITFTNGAQVSVAPGATAALGGAIRSQNVTSPALGAINGATFSQNNGYAKSDSGQAQAYGGAVYAISSNLAALGDVTGATFSQNTSYTESATGNAYAQGGAIYSQSGAGASLGRITGGTFSANKATAQVTGATGGAVAYGGAIYSKGATTSLGIIGGGVLFDANEASASAAAGHATAEGGAIYSNSGSAASIAEIGNASFSNNKASAAHTGVGAFVADARGGAIYSDSNNGESLASGINGPASFTNNQAIANNRGSDTTTAEGGAVHSQGQTGALANGIHGATSFSNNQATASNTGSGQAIASGGAIYSFSATGASMNGGIGNGASFTNNQATASSNSGVARARGGAILSSGVTASMGGINNAAFSGNTATASSNSLTATAYGGAIYIERPNSFNISDNAKFTNNSASASGVGASSAQGGAIFINTDTSGSAFALNLLTGAGKEVLFQGNKTVVNGVETLNDITFGRAGGGNSQMNADLYLSGEGQISLLGGVSVDMNNGKNFRFIKGSLGQLTWGGDNNLLAAGFGAASSSVSLEKGLTVLEPGFALTANAFQLGEVGGSAILQSNLEVGGVGAQISADNIGLVEGATLRFDLLNAKDQSQAGPTTHLTLLSPNTQIIGPGQINAEVLNAGALNGQYLLFHADNNYDFSGRINGIIPTYPNPRYGTVSYDDTQAGKLLLNVIGADIARLATWTNASGDKQWNETSDNWSLDGSALNVYKAGDSAVFTSAGAGEVKVDAAGVNTNQMAVNGGTYTFTGGAINGADLELNSGQMNLANNAAFSGAVQVANNARMGLTAAGSLSAGTFNLASGGQLLVEPKAGAHTLTAANSITLASGSKVGVAGFGYGPKLDDGKYTVLKLNAPTVNNQSGIIASSGKIEVGAHDYKYRNLAWDGNNLTMQVGDATPTPVRTGVGSITGSSAIGAFNPAFNVFNQHNLSLFNSQGIYNPYQQQSANQQLAAGESQSKYLNSLWVTPAYSYTNQNASNGNVGYDLKTPGFALGYDRQLCESAFVGAGVSVSWPEYNGGGAEITANDITFALYGGVKLPYALELDAHLGYGFTRYDQDRQVQNARYNSSYDGNTMFAGLGLGRSFDLGQGFSLRPGLAYDFIHLNTDGFDEGKGVFAIKTDDYSQNIHRVKAGVDATWQHAASGFRATGQVYYLGLYGDRSASASAHFVNDPINGFNMIGNALDENNLGLGLNVALPISERFELGAGYGVLLGSDATSQQGMLNATFKF